MKQTEAAQPRGEETCLCQDMKNGVQSVAQDMSCVAFGWTGIVQRLNGIVQILHTNLSHHGNQDIPGIIPAHQPRIFKSEVGVPGVGCDARGSSHHEAAKRSTHHQTGNNVLGE